ncbi:MAG: hypothetical protein MJ106_05545 [Lentisphaeria bacterium]|nr:hypothetical protein [Lentisphaeria bacterium]
MLKCPKCGTDNLLSAVFCRGCGERMNLDEIKPDDFSNIGTKKDSTTMQNIVGGIIIAVLVSGFLVGFMFPVPGSLSTSEEGQSAAIEKFNGNGSFDMTDQELTDFCNACLARKDASEQDPKPTRIMVRCTGDGTAKIMVRTTFWGFLPGTVVCNCTVESSDGTINVRGEEGSKVKIGLLPVPESMEETLFWPVKSFCSGALRDANDKIKITSMAEGTVSISHSTRVKIQ